MDATSAIEVILPCSDKDLRPAIEATGEKPVATAITGSGDLFIIYRDPRTRTFTVSLVLPNKKQCLVAVGTDFEEIKSGVGL